MRYVLEGEWTGYVSSQFRVVHRAVITARQAKRLELLPEIHFTDGTRLLLTVREATPRERVQEIRGYRQLIENCLRLGVNSVAAVHKIQNAALTAEADKAAALDA